MMYQCWFMYYNKCINITLVQDIDSGRENGYVWGQEVYRHSLLSTQFFYKAKITLKSIN